MIKVEKKAEMTTRVWDPATGNYTDMINVTFVEESDREDETNDLANSSSLLAGVLGTPTGLDRRIRHTQPVLPGAAANLQIGQELPLFINRRLASYPSMDQQKNGVKPRNIQGDPTFVSTFFGKAPAKDIDDRIEKDNLHMARPDLFSEMSNQTAKVETVAPVAAGNEVTGGLATAQPGAQAGGQ